MIPAAVAAGFLLRAYHLGDHGLWYDEVISAAISVGSPLEYPLVGGDTTFTAADLWAGNNLSQVLRAIILEDGGNAPVYSFLLHWWVQTAGMSESSLRLPSVIAGTMALPLLFLLARRLFGAPAAGWATAIATVHPLLIGASRVNRSYALAVLLVIAATHCYVHLIDHLRADSKRAGWWAMGYGLVSGLALLTHYLTASVIAAHLLFSLLRIRGSRNWVHLMLAWLVVIGVLGSWYQLGGRAGMRETARRNRNYQQRAADPAPGEKLALPLNLRYGAAGISQFTLALMGATGQGHRLLPMMILLLPPVLLAFIARHKQNGKAVEWLNAYLFISLLSAAGLALGFALALLSGHIISFQITYASITAPFAVIWIGSGLSRVWTTTSFAFKWCLALMLLLIPSYFSVRQHQSPRVSVPESYRQAIAAAQKVAREGDIVEYGCWETARYCNLYTKSDSRLVQRVNTNLPPNLLRIVEGEQERLRITLPAF